WGALALAPRGTGFDGGPRGKPPLPDRAIGQPPPQPTRIVLEISQAAVAVIAEQEAQPARRVAMIDAELGLRPFLTDRAEALLRRRHEVIIGLGQAVIAPEIPFDVGPRLFLRHRRQAQERP